MTDLTGIDSDRTYLGLNAQHVPVGAIPTEEHLFLAALMWGCARQAIELSHLVLADDMDEPAATIYRAILAVAARGTPPCPQLVADQLRRVGHIRSSTQRWILTAVTSGAVPEVAREYAGAVVAISLRRRAESFGQALVAAGTTGPESSVVELAERAAESLATIAGRLDALRGGEA